MLPAGSRLHTSDDFAAVVRSGRRAGTRHLVVHLLGTGRATRAAGRFRGVGEGRQRRCPAPGDPAAAAAGPPASWRRCRPAPMSWSGRCRPRPTRQQRRPGPRPAVRARGRRTQVGFVPRHSGRQGRSPMTSLAGEGADRADPLLPAVHHPVHAGDLPVLPDLQCLRGDRAAHPRRGHRYRADHLAAAALQSVELRRNRPRAGQGSAVAPASPRRSDFGRRSGPPGRGRRILW